MALLSVGFPTASWDTPTQVHPRIFPDTSSTVPHLERVLAESFLTTLYPKWSLTEPQWWLRRLLRQHLECYSAHWRHPPSLPSPEVPAVCSLGSAPFLSPESLFRKALLKQDSDYCNCSLPIFFAEFCQLLSFLLPIPSLGYRIFNIFIPWSHTTITSSLFPASQLSPGLSIKLPLASFHCGFRGTVFFTGLPAQLELKWKPRQLLCHYVSAVTTLNISVGQFSGVEGAPIYLMLIRPKDRCFGSTLKSSLQRLLEMRGLSLPPWCTL